MSTRDAFLNQQEGRLMKVEGFDADEAQFLRREDAANFADDLDDILSEMESPGFEDGEWINEDVALLAVLGAGEEGRVVQAQAFLLHSATTDAVYLLEMAPVSAATFEELPQVAASLDELQAKLRPA